MSSAQGSRIASNKQLFITPRQLAVMLQVSIRTLWRWRSAGRLPAPVRLGGAVRWRLDDVTRWIDDGCPNLTGGLRPRE